ncbi:GNAT family N-acetyltransferase [Phreatobacter sp.]|uniref:GNAT family N-acetyltransferase n=1 Tax=Phreatobacter sp. TaxID=1966341 RepID=UPI0022CD198A|nr:GNAT family N-acetyltransferase [Phreatobacter sp.]MCZ8316282.1 GNAT family N-acetyltransferase [Phreatobacter sp.]
MSAPTFGFAVDTTPAPRPTHVVLEGRYCRLRPLDPARDSDGLYALSHGPEAAWQWAYLFSGPYAQKADFDAHVRSIAAGTTDPVYWAITDLTDRAIGWLSLMRIDTTHRVIEVGSILYTPALQRTPAATEAQFLLMRYVFETLGYRRYEWKCNDLNEPSKKAALRFGFTFEGLFRQHMIAKGANRDTAWYSMLDCEWPQRRLAFTRWLSPANFDADGRQKVSLAVMNATTAEEGGLTLRRATLRDVPAIAALKEAAYLPNEALTGTVSFPRMVDYADAMATQEIWVAEEDGDLAACAVIAMVEEPVIVSLAVHPRHHGKRYGDAILGFSERRLRDLGAAFVTLYTNAKLTQRIDWYGRRGFLRTDVKDLEDRKVQYMRKDYA